MPFWGFHRVSLKQPFYFYMFFRTSLEAFGEALPNDSEYGTTYFDSYDVRVMQREESAGSQYFILALRYLNFP